MLTEKANELDALRKRRSELRAELEKTESEIKRVTVELAAEIHQDHPLSARESQVLALVRSGKQNKEIGAILNISARTVVYHISNLLKKYHVEDRHNL